MIRRPPRSTRTDTLFPYTTLFRSTRDITEKKQAADDLLSAREALHQSQKLEALGLLTGGVAHDFNNLLMVIRGSAELLRQPALSESKRQRYIDALSAKSDRAAHIDRKSTRLNSSH